MTGNNGRERLNATKSSSMYLMGLGSTGTAGKKTFSGDDEDEELESLLASVDEFVRVGNFKFPDATEAIVSRSMRGGNLCDLEKY